MQRTNQRAEDKIQQQTNWSKRVYYSKRTEANEYDTADNER